MDDEIQRLIEIRKIKLDRLFELDKKAAVYGELDVPPHIQMERTDLRAELGKMQLELGAVETALQAPITSSVGDELGSSGRFLVYYQQNREIKQSIANLAVDFERFVGESKDWRHMHRQWLLIIGITVLFILVVIVAFVAYEAGQGHL